NVPPLPPAPPQPSWLPDRSTSDGPSYPVFVDVWGSSSYPGSPRVPMTPNNWRLWLAGPPGGDPPRTLASAARVLAPPANNNPFSPATTSLTLFASPGDVHLGQDGVPANPVERDNRYSWAYLVRRGAATQPSFLDVTVVVYSGRSLQFTQDLVPSGEA